MNEAQQKAYDQAQVMLAFARGEKIEGVSRNVCGGKWTYLNCSPEWAWHNTDYRIAPKPIEAWVAISNTGAILHTDKSCQGSKRDAERPYPDCRAVLMREVL